MHLGRTAALAVGRVHGTVDDDDAGEAVAVFGAGQDRHEAAEGVRDDDRLLVVAEQAGRFANGKLLARKDVHRVGLAPARIAHAGERHGDDAIVARQIGRDEVPPVRMRAVAVDQQEPRLRGVAPGLVVNAGAVAVGEAGLVMGGDRILEPFGRRRLRAAIDGQRALLGGHFHRLVADQLVFAATWAATFLGHEASPLASTSLKAAGMKTQAEAQDRCGRARHASVRWEARLKRGQQPRFPFIGTRAG